MSLQKINYYLSSVINNLDSLRQDVVLNSIAKSLKEKTICTVLILVSYNILVAQKLYRHILVLVAYYHCEKIANYINKKFNFSSIQNIDK